MPYEGMSCQGMPYEGMPSLGVLHQGTPLWGHALHGQRLDTSGAGEGQASYGNVEKKMLRVSAVRRHLRCHTHTF